jgi:hypothetical protein
MPALVAEHAGDHRRARVDAKLGEDPPQVGGDRPRADAEHIGYGLVGVALRHHARDLALARTQRRGWRRRRDADQAKPDVVDLDVEQPFDIAGPRLQRRPAGDEQRNQLAHQPVYGRVHARVVELVEIVEGGHDFGCSLRTGPHRFGHRRPPLVAMWSPVDMRPGC